MRKTLIFITLLVGLSTASALSLDEAKQLALVHNSRYQAQESSYQSSRWATQQSLGSMLPSLSLSGTYAYLDPATQITAGMSTITLNHDMRSLNLSMSQPIFMGGKLWQAYRIASESEILSKVSLQSTKLSILSEVESKYLSVLQLNDLLEISQKDLQSSEQTLAVAQTRYDNGTLSYPELLKVKSRKATKEVALIQAQTALELARQDLGNVIAMRDWTDLEPVSPDQDNLLMQKMLSWDTNRTAAFTSKALDYASTGNLGLQSASMATKLTERALRIARGSLLPTVVLSAGRAFSENGLDRYEFTGKNTVALTASVPLLPMWGNYSAIRKAAYDVRKSNSDLQTSKDGIDLAVKASALNLISTIRQINAAELALDYSRQTYVQLQERFANNMLSATDILDAEVMLLAAEVNLTNANYSYLKARTALLQTLGTDDHNVIAKLAE